MSDHAATEDQAELAEAGTLVADAEKALVKLEKLCCRPARSPRMEKLDETLTSIRSQVERLGEDASEVDALFETLADAGAQLGWLQVGCCAEGRQPLYTRMTEDLFKAQRQVAGFVKRTC